MDLPTYHHPSGRRVDAAAVATPATMGQDSDEGLPHSGLFVDLHHLLPHLLCGQKLQHHHVYLLGLSRSGWIWDLARGYTQFEFNRKYAGLAVLLLIMPFLYPLLSWLRGLSFPEITSPVMPCSVVVFTFGLLLLMSRKVNLFIILLLSHWAMIGLSKTYFFNIPEDFLLVATTIPALYLFFKDYYLRHLTDDATKPRRKYVNLLLMTLSIGIAVILIICLVMELTTDVPTHHPVVINTPTPLAIP